MKNEFLLFTFEKPNQLFIYNYSYSRATFYAPLSLYDIINIRLKKNVKS